jgi:hypothetical protein
MGIPSKLQFNSLQLYVKMVPNTLQYEQAKHIRLGGNLYQFSAALE